MIACMKNNSNSNFLLLFYVSNNDVSEKYTRILYLNKNPNQFIDTKPIL